MNKRPELFFCGGGGRLFEGGRLCEGALIQLLRFYNKFTKVKLKNSATYSYLLALVIAQVQ